jgi:4-hydroxybenzoate polyprenyltransferase
VLGNRSIPIEYGERKASIAVILLSLTSIAQIFFFLRFVNSGMPAISAYLMIFLEAAAILAVYWKKDYKNADRLMKAIIIWMVLSIPFI